jgi:hypothetical protein
MKTLLVAAALGFVAVGALAQGQFTFGNKNLAATPPIDAKVFSEKAVPLDGVAYWTQAYVKLATDPDSSYAPVGSAVNFRTGNNAGYIVPVVVTTPYGGGIAINVEMRAWEASGGTSYEAAIASGKLAGKSLPVNLNVTVAPNAPADMTGLTSFNLSSTVIPEPSTFALGLLGAAALVLRRRS